MAALAFIVCSACEQFFRVGSVFVRSRGSLGECWIFLTEQRQQYLTRRYLEHLDRQLKDNNDNNSQYSFGVNRKVWLHSNILASARDCLQREPMEDEIYEFVEAADVADSIVEWRYSPEMVGAQMIQEAGLVFSCSALGDVTPGTSFYISGTILHNCERFSINLTLGLHNKDIALHINPRLPQNYIVRNCKINGHWGKEEVTSALPFSLQRGHRFAMQVLVTESEYYISVNGQHFASFRHRLPYCKVTCLQVVGDVTDVQVEQLAVMEYPDKLASSNHDEAPSTVRGNVIKTLDYLTEDTQLLLENDKDLEIPYSAKLIEKFRSGTRLHIYGRVKILPHSFYVNLQKGDHIWPHPTIAFHFNPRFANVGGKHVICRNSWFDGKWDREERNEISTDFMPSRNFHLSIDCSDGSYQVFVNGKFIADYRFRVPPDTVDTIYIQGDIKLNRVLLETSPIMESIVGHYDE